MTHFTTRIILALTAVTGITLLTFSGNAETEASALESATTEQAVTVTAISATTTPIHLWSQFSGRIAAVETADIRPQVSGRITKIHFGDGDYVTAGDLLMEIDPRPFKAALKETEATLAAATSAHILAKREYERAQKLWHENAISERIYDARRNDETTAKNSVKAAEAERIKAEINLDHALVKAPITGRLSRAELTVGNLVEAGPSAPLLTTIVANDKVYAEFDIDEQTYLTHIHANTKDKTKLKTIPVRATVGDGRMVATGTIHSFDNQINPTTGTIRVRAIFDNPNGALLPGMYVSVDMAMPTTTNHIMVPESAIGVDQDRRFVYRVTDENLIAYQEVQLGSATQDGIIIESGITAGDTIVIEAIMMLRPGMLVTVTQPNATTHQTIQ